MVLADGHKISETKVIAEVNELVKKEIGAFSALGGGLILQRLPKTRSGKILRATLKKLANKMEYKVPATIEDETVLDTIKDQLELHFHSKNQKAKL